MPDGFANEDDMYEWLRRKMVHDMETGDTERVSKVFAEIEKMSVDELRCLMSKMTDLVLTMANLELSRNPHGPLTNS